MKKYFVLLIFSGIYSFCSIAQTTKCNDSLIMSIRGTWKNNYKISLTKEITKPVNDQMVKRADAIHQMLLGIYPQPIGCETRWDKIFSTSAEVPWVYTFYYYTAVFEYTCTHNKPEKNGETTTYFNVVSNQFNNFWKTTGITINGQAVYSRKPKFGTWNGYDTYGDDVETFVILTRKDMLPYKPVTRKQYIAYKIHWIDSFYTVLINGMKNSPEPQQELITDVTNTKNRFLKLNQKELEKSGAKNLLDSPAVITPLTIHNFDDHSEVFTTEENGGSVLLTVNAAYFRKDLPKYIPQFIIVRLGGNEYPTTPLLYFRKTIKEKFTFEKLQAMIDK